MPRSVAGSIGSPDLSFFAFSSTSWTNSSATLSTHQDALHRRAALAGVLGRAGDRKLGRLVEIGVLHDDQRIVAAELQHDAAVAGLVGDVLADLHRAGEGDEVAVRVGDHRVADGRRIAGDDREHFRRQAGLVEHVGERQRGQRRQLGRLQHHAVVGGDRGRDLVRHHVERMVERRDRRDDAVSGIARGEDLALLALRRDIAGIDLAVVLDGELAGERIDVVGAARLVERVLPAQPELRRDDAGELLLARARAARRS